MGDVEEIPYPGPLDYDDDGKLSTSKCVCGVTVITYGGSMYRCEKTVCICNNIKKYNNHDISKSSYLKN
jgi:hypothetical protein